MLAFERLAEEKIRDAIAAGEFEHLPGKGKPLPLDDYFSVRTENRMAHLVLKNSNFLPEHLQLRKELETSLHELEKFWQHCRQRLRKLLANFHAAQDKEKPSAQNPPNPRHAFVGRQIILLRKWREQNSTDESGKRVGAAAGSRIWRRNYLTERLWLRHRLGELANRTSETAQRLHEALVEKEIREQRPLVLWLGGPFISVENILLRFDREFPDVDAA